MPANQLPGSFLSGGTYKYLAETHANLESANINNSLLGASTMPYRYLYQRLLDYYLSNGLYDVIIERLRSDGLHRDLLLPLRNPATRVVEFYAGKLWPGQLPGGLPIVSENEALPDIIERIWKWSNWSSEKQVCARWFAIYGDLFIKVSTDAKEDRPASRVYLQNLDPTWISDVKTEERGYITFLRQDLPTADQQGQFTHTEVWTLDSLRIWRNEKGMDVALEELGNPTSETPLSELGIDFIPIVHTKLREVGMERGVGAYTLHLDKIDEANRLASRLHKILFRHNKALWGLTANAMDAGGKPLPPPIVGGSTAQEMDLEDDTIIGLPGMSDLKSLVPNLNYQAALEILRDHMAELENDLPELSYFSLRTAGDISGRAARILLGDAIDRAAEARAKGLDAMRRAHMMAITVGTELGLLDNVGSYENGDLEHTLNPMDPFQPSLEEVVDSIVKLTSAGVPIIAALRMAGVDEATMDMVVDEMNAAQIRDVDLASAYVAEAERNASRTQGFTVPATNGQGV